MKSEVGLWIDNQKTVIVMIENDKDVTREVRSNIEKPVRSPNGSHAKIPTISQRSEVEDMGDSQYERALNGYYKGIISLIRNAESILIFGPGDAKDELKKRLENDDLGERIVGIETENKMSDRQIVAKVRTCFIE
ncbi:MAG: hypothetical protein ACM3PY_22270 [Omnitrophica WOR_2 bacterium]